MPKDDLYTIFGSTVKDNILVFPNLFTLSPTIIDKVLSTHTPVIGKGFYKQDSVYDLIKKILEKKNRHFGYLCHKSFRAFRRCYCLYMEFINST